MSTSSFREESSAYLGGPKERKKVMREIMRLEAEELRKMQGGNDECYSDGETSYNNTTGSNQQHNTSEYVSPYAVLSHQQRQEEKEMGGGSSLPGLMMRSRMSPSPFGGGSERGAAPQQAHVEAISQPRIRPASTFTDYLRAPAALRRRGLRSPDVLFQPAGPKSSVLPPRPQAVVPETPFPKTSTTTDDTANSFFMTGLKVEDGEVEGGITAPPSSGGGKRVSLHQDALPGVEADAPHTTSTSHDGIFWVYGRHKVSQSTLGSSSSAASAKSPSLTEEQFKKLPLWHDICKKLSSMIRDGSKRDKFGILFDLVSTGKVIAKGTSHLAGRLIYDYVENCRLEMAITKLKFVFVGITDNVNCCAARDVFCLDDSVGGKYVGEFKRTFNALDGVHMFAVLPPAYAKWCDETVKQLTRPAAAIKAEQEAKHQVELQKLKQQRNRKQSTVPPMRW